MHTTNTNNSQAEVRNGWFETQLKENTSQKIKNLPPQLFLHSTNLYRTHGPQNEEAQQVYLTYIIATLHLSMICLSNMIQTNER